MASKRYNFIGQLKNFRYSREFGAKTKPGPEMAQRLVDHQFDRAARWLRSHPGDLRPPRHILEKIAKSKKDLQAAGLIVIEGGKIWPVVKEAS